jgi:hypothetical protein
VRIAAAQIKDVIAVLFILTGRFVLPRPVASFIVIRRVRLQLQIITRRTDV